MREALAAMQIAAMSTAAEVVLTGVLFGILPGALKMQHQQALLSFKSIA